MKEELEWANRAMDIKQVRVPKNLTAQKVAGVDKQWTSLAQKLSQEKARREGCLMDGTKRDPKTLVPKGLWKHWKVFDNNASNRLPKHGPYDVEINFQEGAKLPSP